MRSLQLPQHTYSFPVYRAQRANGMRAYQAISFARAKKRDHDFPWHSDYAHPKVSAIVDVLEELFPDMSDDRRAFLAECIEDEASYGESVYRWAVLLRDNFVVFVRVVSDGDHIFNDGRGRYQDYYEPGAIMTEYARSQRRHYVGRVRKPRRIQPRRHAKYDRYSYFSPDYDHEQTWFVPVSFSISQQQAAYHGMGYAKHDAWLKALEDAHREEDFAHGEGLEVYGVVASVLTTDGTLLSESSAWGVEVADDDSSLTECAESEICDAVRNAKKQITAMHTAP